MASVSGRPVRTRVKICGITRAEDAEAAVRHGADAIGLVFHPKSPRAVDAEAGRALAQAVPAFVTVTALFVDPEPERVRAVLDTVPVELLQFHGNESPEFCASFGRRYIKALPMGDDAEPAAAARRYGSAAGLLLDAFSATAPGGTGTRFDWSRIPADLGLPLILAGGLAPENVADALRAVRPYAVDVSSGVERAKGIKDEDKIAAFMRGVASV